MDPPDGPRFSVEGSDKDGISVPVDQEDVGKEFVFTVPWAQRVRSRLAGSCGVDRWNFRSPPNY